MPETQLLLFSQKSRGLNDLCGIFSVPGDPQDVTAVAVNSTTVLVTWTPPAEKDRNGIIRGYHVHVQEVKEEVSFWVKCFWDIWLMGQK